MAFERNDVIISACGDIVRPLTTGGTVLHSPPPAQRLHGNPPTVRGLVQKAGIEPAPHCILFGDLHIAPFSAIHYHCETSVYYDEVRGIEPIFPS